MTWKSCDWCVPSNPYAHESQGLSELRLTAVLLSL